MFLGRSSELSASRAFPILADFETPLQLSRWESDMAVSYKRDIVRNGRGATKVPRSAARCFKASLEFFPRRIEAIGSQALEPG